MSDAPPAAVKAATPAPGSQTSPGPTSSPVNSQSASSKANQQAAAAGENQGLTNQDQSQAVQSPESKPNQEIPTAQATEGQATLDPARFKSSGNEIVDQITNLLSNRNFSGAEDIVAEVYETQELSLASKAKLVEELGADISQLVINQLEMSVQQAKQKGEQEGKRLKEYAFSKIGGENPESTWAGLQQFAQSPDSGLSSEDKKVMNKMLQEGGLQAEMVIDSLLSKYQKTSSYTNPPQLMQGDTIFQSGFQPMSKQEYQSEIGPAIAKYGESSQEVQALRNRRAISMSRGYN